MLAGVSGGLASYFEIHPAFFRVGFVVLTLLGGSGIVIYLAAALVMPDEGKEDSVVSAALRNRRDRPWPLIGIALLGVAGVILLSHATLWPNGDAWIVLLLAGAAILWVTRQGKVEPATDAKQLAARDSRRIRRFFVALAVAFFSLVALVLVAAAIFAAVVHVHVGRGVGERTYNVAGIQDLRENYRLGIGRVVLDLSDVQLPAGKTHVNARVDVGRLDVIVPPGVALRVHGDTQFGDVNLLGSVSGGHDVERSVAQDGKRVLVLDAHVGAGSLRVNRAVR
jgi:phage shock protein PspC (stress-responsive transcriptional regulator)/predicted membrane protein